MRRGCYARRLLVALLCAVAACADAAPPLLMPSPDAPPASPLSSAPAPASAVPAPPPYIAGTRAVLEGAARVVDGDTLTIGGARVRMKGIAAPERAEPFGADAAAALAGFIGEAPVRCLLTGERSRDRAVGYCFAGERDLGRAMVAGGFALACPRFSDRYLGDEAAPRRARIGVWAAGYALPAYCQAP